MPLTKLPHVELAHQSARIFNSSCLSGVRHCSLLLPSYHLMAPSTLANVRLHVLISLFVMVASKFLTMFRVRWCTRIDLCYLPWCPPSYRTAFEWFSHELHPITISVSAKKTINLAFIHICPNTILSTLLVECQEPAVRKRYFPRSMTHIYWWVFCKLFVSDL